MVIFDQFTPAVSSQPAGVGFLMINSADPFGRAETDRSVEAGRVSAWADDHPALRDIDPTVFAIRRRTHLRSLSSVRFTTLLAGESGPLIVEAQRTEADAGGRCVYWLFDLAETDLPMRMGFPVMVWNTLDYLAGRSESAGRSMLLTGQPLRLDHSDETRPPRVFNPAGDALAVRRDGTGWRCDQSRMQGVYRTDGAQGSLAVNLLSARGIEPLPSQEAVDAIPSAPAGLMFRRWDMPLNWRTVMVAMLALGLIEWLLFSRGWIRLG